MFYFNSKVVRTHFEHTFSWELIYKTLVAHEKEFREFKIRFADIGLSPLYADKSIVEVGSRP